MSTSMSIAMLATFMTFIFVIETGPGLGLVGSKLFYDGAEMSQIASIYDVFVKSSRELICDVQYMMLTKIGIDTFL
jgi:hypothetical protein